MLNPIAHSHPCRTGMLAIWLAAGFAVFSSSSGQAQPAHFENVNSEEYTDSFPVISNDGKSLYFVSNQPAEGLAGHNIWVAQRAGRNHPWSEPVPLGPNVNSSFDDLAPALSRDGHLLLFASDRPGGEAALNLWVSWRADIHDDIGWQPAVYFGPVDMDPGLASFADLMREPLLAMEATAADSEPQLEPFVVRAPLDPFKIHQNPGFMIHSRAPSELVIRRGVFPKGVGGWHTHPGPSIAYVLRGQIKIQKFTKQDGCTESPVFGPGDIYLKPGNEVHRAIVVSEEDAVEMIAGLIPIGESIGALAEDPGCFQDQSFGLAATPVNTPSPSAQPVTLTMEQEIAPFETIRGAMDPFKILQNPEFMIHSRAQTDFVVQRLEFAPGAGGWHTHPGPSFIYVVKGQIKLQKFTKKEGCIETEVFGPGQAYFEIGNEVHRAVVLSDENAVLLVVRFLPAGEPITTPADDPGC
jgi:quercetin dioxygenase-like cupin family protein